MCLRIALVSPLAATNRIKKNNLPATELVNRRKSPALWRNDLQPQESTTPLLGRRALLQKPQVMAPAGGWPQVKAAVANGADAVFLGLETFSARARAANFNAQQLYQAVEYCHNHQVQVYVALNTLVFDTELAQVEELVRLCDTAKVDALIIQDLGVAQLAHQVAPSLHIHASTQQSVTSADGVAFCSEYSHATRVVVGRELSVEEIAQCHSSDESAELEAFVHGALCVSYSGQCFSSEAWGGRSANRGQCAQACRLPYGLIVNGELRDLQDMAYLLSPQDLCGVDMVPQLIQAGVSCLKIEGRLKDEFYVAATTRAYRNAVDEAWEALTKDSKDDSPSVKSLSFKEEVTKKELQQLFSRGQDEEYGGLTSGFLEGTQHQVVVRGRSPRHRGVHVGRVVEGSSPKNGLLVSNLNLTDLKLGDGLVVDRGMAQEEELGGPIFEIEELRDDTLRIRFGREVERKWKRADDNARKGISGSCGPLAPVGAHVWRTSDAAVDKKMRKLSAADSPRMTAHVSVEGSVGEPLVVTIVSGSNRAVGRTDELLEEATGSGLDPAKVRKAIGSLGNTRWALDGDIDVDGLSSNAWCPMSRIKEARRRAVEELERVSDRKEDSRMQENSLAHGVAARMLKEASARGAEASSGSGERPRLSVLARNLEQVDAVCRMAERGDIVDEIIIDFLEIDGMQSAVSKTREANVRAVVASPRIIKPGESGIWRTLLRLEPDGLLVRSAGLLYRMKQLGGAGASVDVGSENEEHLVTIPDLIGDFSLNAANALTAMELLDAGLERITASYDLNAQSIKTMAQLMGSSRSRHLEVVAHMKMPVFHTEHCVFARFLSNGNSYLDCGHVCTRNNVHLRDQSGCDNLVLADMGCRNTVFAAQAQSGVQSIRQWVDAGVGHIRVELVDEGAEDVETVVGGYLGVLDGTLKPSAVWESLQYVRDSNGRTAGVSLGSFRNTEERKAGAL